MEIQPYQNQFNGETAFILGTGPSIVDLDLSVLRNRLVFTVNGATLLQEKFDLKPTFFCTSDARFLTSEKRDLAYQRLHADTIRLVRDVIRPFDDPSAAGRTAYVSTLGKNGFSENMLQGFYFWCTSISLAVQMAWFCGARKIALLGVDLNYVLAQPRFYQEEKPQPVDPYVGVQIWNVANASRRIRALGGQMVLCSEMSMLRPYVDYENFLDVV